jgi:hypothetical protein
VLRFASLARHALSFTPRFSDVTVVLRRGASTSDRPPPSPKPQFVGRSTVTLHHAFKQFQVVHAKVQ